METNSINLGKWRRAAVSHNKLARSMRSPPSAPPSLSRPTAPRPHGPTAPRPRALGSPGETLRHSLMSATRWAGLGILQVLSLREMTWPRVTAVQASLPKGSTNRGTVLNHTQTCYVMPGISKFGMLHVHYLATCFCFVFFKSTFLARPHVLRIILTRYNPKIFKIIFIVDSCARL